MNSGDRSNKITINYTESRCLYTRSIWAECSSCAETCPSRAITFERPDRPPSLNGSICIQCGQCLSACPVEAFESSTFSERQLLGRLESQGVVRMHCFLPYDALSTLGSGVSTYQLGTCLAALTPGALFELGLDRTCELSTERCARCSLYPSVSDTIRRNFRMAEALLADWGRDAHLVDRGGYAQEHDEDSESTARCAPGEPVALGGGSLAREEALRVLRGEARDDDLACDGEEWITPKLRSSISRLFEERSKTPYALRPIKLRQVRSSVPSWRSRLKNIWTSRSDEVGEGFPWPVMVVDTQKCTACGMCMQMCPTGAITLFQSDDEFVHSMTPGSCIDCQLCLKSCFAGALSRSYQELLDPFTPQERSSREAFPCARCGLPVLEGDGPYCRLCSSNHDAVTLMERVHNQMDMVRETGRKAGVR